MTQSVGRRSRSPLTPTGPLRPIAPAASTTWRPRAHSAPVSVERLRPRTGVLVSRKARLFNREQDTRSGTIVWTHTQTGDAASHYAIYFEIVKTESTHSADGVAAGAVWQSSPAPWIGDVDVLRERAGQPLGGFAHFTPATGDLNGDGLFDILAGMEKGDLVWFSNRGSKGKPEFRGCRFLRDEEGPIDTGWYGAPYLFDWDADGRSDLLVGTSGNVILWWRNVGTRGEPQLRFRGFVEADGGRLQVPEEPVVEDTNGIFKRDYYNQPWVGDWNGDGLPDIVTGGYTTGRVFFYRGVSRSEDGVPRLVYEGSIEDDGMPLDTVWAAAPTAYDFDADGRLELITGSWWWSGIPHAPAPGEIEYLQYYRDRGPQGQPLYRREPLPRLPGRSWQRSLHWPGS